MIKRVIYFFLLAGCAVQFFGCRKDNPEDKQQVKFTTGISGGVFITNEGNFQFGNAKVSYYDNASATAVEDLFQPANNISLGDVCQSMYLFNGKAYVVVNNSGKIVVVNPKTFVQETVISGMGSPRYFLPVSNNKAYVTDLYANAVSIVDLNGNIKTGTIACSGWTEEMALVYGKVFVTNEKSNKVYVINTANDAMEDSIQVGFNSNSIRQDKNGKLWVLCSGNQKNNIPGSLHRIDPITKQVEQSFQFSNTTDSPWKLRMNATNDTLYFLNNSVFRMAIGAANLPSTAFISNGKSVFYGLGIDPKNGVIYISDAIDYVQRGAIYRYKSDGTLINTFKAGIAPGDFCFN